MKKGDLSINTIIIAVIAVLVLVVLVLIFTGKIDILQQVTTDCESTHKGTCMLRQQCVIAGGSDLTQQDCPQGEICCKTLLDS